MQKTMAPTIDENAVVIYGPNGVVLTDTQLKSKVVTKPDSVEISTDGRIDLNGTVYINGVKYVDHTHKNVTSGSSNSGPVNV
jgi:hypothetical protein